MQLSSILIRLEQRSEWDCICMPTRALSANWRGGGVSESAVLLNGASSPPRQRVD